MSNDIATTAYELVIGLEVHVELSTASKMFCRCSSDYFGQEPNTHTCPVCLGLPGALPVPNAKAIEGCIMIGLALNCEIALFSQFDRKHYYYPDLPKGYQISQYQHPFCAKGYIMLSNDKKIRIRRVHMEEDTGKLMHQDLDGRAVSLIDFNRSGVPLVEIVTEPDFENAEQVKEYLQKLQQIIRYLGVAAANPDKGEMRFEPNISVRKPGQTSLPDYKVEVKNINSFSFVERAINYELKRQSSILERGETPIQETRGWDEKRHITLGQRTKEEAMDYRYFPEPDIPPFQWQPEQIDALRKTLPELADAKKARFIQSYHITDYDAELLTRERGLADFFEETVKVGQQQGVEPKTIANVIINKKVDIDTTVPAELIKDIVVSRKIEAIDETALQAIVSEAITSNPKAVEDYKKGKTNAVMFLVGACMRQLKGKATPERVKELLVARLDAM
ncbi:MAG TPA: Asp-tRNA(Asn)/Glu-tRNA(Gln) amidotransferase subunit GatB [Ktedonobacteraceae bacterium]|nr:Asp-tRNA(Asn)/Glu-tRNA(Gln) amidotransferase subunit GatB [Ktedonobacteraceae bacterium]